MMYITIYDNVKLSLPGVLVVVLSLVLREEVLGPNPGCVRRGIWCKKKKVSYAEYIDTSGR